MKRKNITYLIVLVALAGVAVWLWTGQTKSSTLTERKMDYDFTIKDTASVDKIIISDKSPAEVTLTRTEDGWMVDGEHRARKGAVDLLLKTFYRMEMRNFVPKRMQSTVSKRMAVFGKKVQVYQNGELFKEFYVGTETHDEMATYMMIKGSDAPYAVAIPGFNGYLSSRFFPEAYLWRSRDVTYMDPRDISEVRMVYPDSAETSFHLEILEDGPRLTRLSDNKVFTNLHEINTKLYLSEVSNIKYEGTILPSDGIYARRDSLLASRPVFELEITDREGEVTNLRGYRIKGPEESFDPELDAPVYDPDKMHGFINKDRMVLLQFFGLRKVMIPGHYLTRPASIVKNN